MHYNEESLSLKWLAENYLFISVGYLSKQFVKEEGIRFSEYLNGIRMEEAKKLLNLYSFDNIKNIVRQVGFGNNPHYFSQVFKRYTGYTPKEYLDNVF
ncbi:helix-turn-helix transcriptional regulator [Anaerocolumna sedimenticola]|uniref:helix-turn-helix transcriptional regulator n=1 Tax=Anaerocolumna sedimenticola TaxID=2696063 RepID=UPI00248407D4|nr:helix-turn-helix transcriptional regulator [Anaerocolumna sedimenticola]